MLLETARYGSVVGVPCPGSRIHDDVHGREFVLMQPEGFSDETFDPITPHCAADDARRDGQAEPGDWPLVRSNENSEQGIGKPSRIFVDAIEVRFVVETLRRSERPGGCLQVRFEQRGDAEAASDRQTLAALGAATCQHQTAGTSSHTRTEAVCTSTVDLAGVVSALHAAISWREIRAKTSTWWVEKKGGKGTHGLAGCQAHDC